MKLFYAPTSPYARIARAALVECGLDTLVEQHEATLRDPASALLPYNPVGRVPTLVLDSGVVLTETLLILSYFDTLHDRRPLLPRDGADSWNGLARLGMAIGMLDGIAVWNRELRRPEHERSPGVLALETTRTYRVLDSLETMVADGTWSGPTEAAHLALGAALGYCDVRHKPCDWRTGRPALVAWFGRINATPSFQATLPRLA
jgi:glutathione S-transferase